MLFNTLNYAIFLAIVFWGSWVLVRHKKVRLAFLLGASYFFYANWDVRFLPLIWASSTADFLLARTIARTEDPAKRRVWLFATVVLNLGVLGFFKYFNFGVETATNVLNALGFHPPEIVLRVALPIGISFFTFESMSYVIDVYRKELPPCESYLEYLTFVAFFPHLVAGPIVRPKDLLPQLSQAGRFDPNMLSEGLFLIAVGLCKKIMIGDYLALNLIDRVFDAPLMYSGLENYAAVVAYAVQIYCDFSGYTDIAIGSALLLGVRFPLNFDSPYQSANIIEFWRRWHISLSTWLRDYLYIPLGGNRRGSARTYFNLFATMVLGGLWHGAAWTFVAWGALHGLALALNRWFRDFASARPQPRPFVIKCGLVFLTFHFVCFAWIFFRARDFGQAQLVLSQITTLTHHHPNLHLRVLLVLALGLLSHFVPGRWFSTLQNRFIHAHFPVQGLALAVVAILLRRMASADAVPFVYFQF